MVIDSALDACAMLAYLRDEAGADVVEGLLADPSATCYAHSVNLCEVYYIQLREFGEVTARRGIDALLADGVVERSDLDREFWVSVGAFKSRGRIALPDCFCLTLAGRMSAQVVTADHKEFDPLLPLALCPILFIR